MISMPATIDGDTYKYVMSVIEIFSRFLFLRPLQTKYASEVTEHLLDIYIEHGPPEILQSDQGPEFKGVVKSVCETLKGIRIIKKFRIQPSDPRKRRALTQIMEGKTKVWFD